MGFKRNDFCQMRMRLTQAEVENEQTLKNDLKGELLSDSKARPHHSYFKSDQFRSSPNKSEQSK